MECEATGRCVFCGALGAKRGTTTIDAGRQGIEVEIRGVPADLCPTCGEAAIDGPLAGALWDAIEAIIRRIEQENVVPGEARAQV